MLEENIVNALGPALAGALTKRGFESLTPVQAAVLAEDASTHDLRISSQTGSGKTVAIGLALRDFLAEKSPPEKGVAMPRVIVVTPTRELAKQVREELAWLYAPLGARVASVTGGGGYRDEIRAFAEGPSVIVGTPGRLLDHLQRGGINPKDVAAAVLDEADRMLDLGFREDIESILGTLPEEHRTHLVSATFPRDVRALADRVQKNVINVEGTPIGRANADIEHVIHLVHVHEKFDAIVNLLLEDEGAQTLIFARTRADVAQMTRRLYEAGFSVDSLSGEMEQRERTRALSAFKRGDLDALVATDVAARGIDVVDIARVIHADAPEDADSYTHRSGRTGRAGKKGKSSVLVSPGALPRASMLLRRAGVTFTLAKIPDADAIRKREDDKLVRELSGTADENDATAKPDARAREIAATLTKNKNAEEAIARLVMRVRGKRPDAREVTVVEMRGNDRAAMRPDSRTDSRNGDARFDSRGGAEPRARREHDPDARWVSFRVSWGQVHGAEVRRVLAMVCRRGGIGSESVGSIRIAPTYSVVDVAEAAAAGFAEKTAAPDPRDPRVVISQWRGDAPSHHSRPQQSSEPRSHAPTRRPFGSDTRSDARADTRDTRTDTRPNASPNPRPHSSPRPHAHADAPPHAGTKRPEKKPHRKGQRPASNHDSARHDGPRPERPPSPEAPRVPPPARSRPAASSPRIPQAAHSKPRPAKK